MREGTLGRATGRRYGADGPALPYPTTTGEVLIDTRRLFSLEGRAALITGGSRGIGRMIAEGYISQGARVYITARKRDACDATAAEPGRRSQRTAQF